MQILIVVVLYKTSLGDSESIAGLSRSFEMLPQLLDSMSILIWDNSPSRLDNPELPFSFEYMYAGENLGISSAYNRAMLVAEASGCPWLMFLDQDTTLTDNFLLRMLEYSREQEENSRIAAVAPYLMVGSGPMSPGVIDINHTKPLPLGLSGEYTKGYYAANSGMLMRV